MIKRGGSTIAGSSLVGLGASPRRWSRCWRLAIRLESPGHPIYTPDPRRQGRRSRSRSTSCARWSAAPSSPAPGSRSRRATTGSRGSGALLRRYSLDELPNLWNVLRGEMSIVGPRPTLPVQVEQYTERQRGRLAVKPGITGWAQVNGRASLPWSERIELDLWYVEHRSLALDLRDPGADRADGRQRARASTRERRADGSRRRRRPARPASASATTSSRRSPSTRPSSPPIPTRSRRRSTRRTTACAVPRIDDPDYVPGAAGAVRASTTSARSCR